VKQFKQDIFSQNSLQVLTRLGFNAKEAYSHKVSILTTET